MLLTSAPGCGKTMLVQNVSRRLSDAGIQVFTIATPRANGHSLLLQILGDNSVADRLAYRASHTGSAFVDNF